jgi:predicted dithiol-disulfide oxidoreductase (DUF899 family)
VASRRRAKHDQQIVSLAAREAYLRSEDALTRARDLVRAKRRALPWVMIAKANVFETHSDGERR